MNHLVEVIKAGSRPLLPQPTGMDLLLPRLQGIRAVLFDVYGTLFVSGSGDISLAGGEDRGPALGVALQKAGFTILKSKAPLGALLHSCIERARIAMQAAGTPHPEVCIQTVWSAFIDTAAQRGWLLADGALDLAIVDYECRVNPCWPMPGAMSLLQDIRIAGLAMGIISNAQFYTPLLFEALMGRTVQELGFDRTLCIWSYQHLLGKPSTALFSMAARQLDQAGIDPPEVLFVGNDLRNDIWPAQETGFKTALFAGDARSLRLRNEHPQARQTQPDVILGHLNQLPKVLGLDS